MDRKDLLEKIKQVRESSKERKFKQSFDLFIALKNIDLAKADNKVDLVLTLPHMVKTPKICAFVDKEMEVKAKEICYKVITKAEFSRYTPRMARKLADECDYFLAQANIMGEIATVFGKFLGSRGKMPNPKIGGVVPPTGDLKTVVEKLKKLFIVKTKNTPTINLRIGAFDMKDEEIAANIEAVVTSVENALPQKKEQMRAVYLKTTMGPTVKIYG